MSTITYVSTRVFLSYICTYFKAVNLRYIYPCFKNFENTPQSQKIAQTSNRASKPQFLRSFSSSFSALTSNNKLHPNSSYSRHFLQQTLFLWIRLPLEEWLNQFSSLKSRSQGRGSLSRLFWEEDRFQHL